MAEQTLAAALEPAVALGMVVSLGLAAWLRGRTRTEEKPVPVRVTERRRG